MDSLTEKIVQLLVSHSAFRALEVCESEGDWRGKYQNSIISVLFSIHSCFVSI